MTERAINADRLLDLAEAICDETASVNDAAQLNIILLADENARRRYLDYCQLHFTLDLESQTLSAVQKVHQQIDLEPELPRSDQPSAPIFLSTTLPGTVGFFSSGWPVAYLIATVICGIGILIGSFTYVSPPEQVATQSPSVVKDTSASEPQPELIGQITGMVDCQWATKGLGISDWGLEGGSKSKVQPSEKVQSLIPNPQSVVRLGDKFALASGLMEITYDTGAKVILQGPVTYQVESPAGGFLSVGKLTARLEKKAEGANPQSLIPNPSSPSTIHYPLFTITTPTATVTDLGTEFGVEVRESGATSAHVFHGIVEVQPAAKDGTQQGRSVRLAENQSVHIDKRQDSSEVTVERGTADAAAFVRAEQLPKLAAEQRFRAFRRWQAYSQQLRRDPSLLAYYDFQLEEGKPAVLRNVAANGDHEIDGVVENATWSTGRMLGKHALLFRDPSDFVRVNLPQKIDDLTFAAWVCIDSLGENPLTALVASTGWLKPGQIHWQMARDGHLGLACTSGSLGNCETRPAVIGGNRLRRWIHLACVYDHAASRVRFYVDGQNVGELEYRTVGPITIGPACIGNWDREAIPELEPRNFRGRIDELAIFRRALTADQVQQLYQAASPQRKPQTQQ